jgi:long-chain acyl-CoA synthetase
MSETSPAITFNRFDMLRKIGSVGTPVWGVEVKAVDDAGREVPTGEAGEILVRGHNVLKGYHSAPETTAEALRDGWLRTGDIGRFDDDGYLYIVDRLKDMINRGGQNVYPTEVEKMLHEHPAISTVAVIGAPDEKYGEEIKAYVVLAPGARTSEDEIIAWARNRMAAHKYPRRVEFVSSLPVSANGKILKRELRARKGAAVEPCGVRGRETGFSGFGAGGRERHRFRVGHDRAVGSLLSGSTV